MADKQTFVVGGQLSCIEFECLSTYFPNLRRIQVNFEVFMLLLHGFDR